MTTAKKSPQIRAPSFLTRAEKRQFTSLVSAHFGRGKSISAGQADALGAYVQAQSRLSVLARAWRASVRAERESENAFGDASAIIAIAKQIDATTSLSRRLAKEAGLS